MSGGSFNWLCHQELEGIGYHTDDIEAMRDFLSALGYADDVVLKTQAVIDGIASLKTQIDALHGVWLSAEWWQSGDSAEDALQEALIAHRAAAGPKPMPGLIEGRIVHFQFPFQGEGLESISEQHFPAIVAEVVDKSAGVVNLVVFIARGVAEQHTIIMAEFSETPKPGCWHWIERA